MNTVNVHASCVAFGNKAVLIRGPSGAGKSDLALRLIDSQGFGTGGRLKHAVLVSDDQVLLLRENSKVMVFPPPTLAGKFEIRGIGILQTPYRLKANLELVIDLKSNTEIERMPEYSSLETEILGLIFRRYDLDAFSPSAAAKIRALLS